MNDNKLTDDNNDVKHEIRVILMRRNILLRCCQMFSTH